MNFESMTLDSENRVNHFHDAGTPSTQLNFEVRLYLNAHPHGVWSTGVLQLWGGATLSEVKRARNGKAIHHGRGENASRTTVAMTPLDLETFFLTVIT